MCLSRVCRFGECPEEEFSEQIRDLPERLRELANQLESPPADTPSRVELPGLQGYSIWAESYDDCENNPVIQAEERVIWDIIGETRGLRVLDVGCGTGRHALALAAAGAQVTGIEPTTEMLEKAREKARARGLDVHFCEGAIDTLEAGLGQFELVLCCLVLSHVADLAGAIEKLSLHVSAGGRLIISDMHPVNVLVGYRTSCSHGGREYVVPNFYHQPSDYYSGLRAAGLELQRFLEVGEEPRLRRWPQTIVMEARRPQQ